MSHWTHHSITYRTGSEYGRDQGELKVRKLAVNLEFRIGNDKFGVYRIFILKI
jgi:hypothetical protein